MTDVIITGVGGQGTVLASRVLAAVAVNIGEFVRTAETLGMAQRGGSVVSHFRTDSEKKGSLIPKGAADLLLAFEPSEAARAMDFLAPDGTAVVNTALLKPASVTSGAAVYDTESILAYIKEAAGKVYFLDAQSIAVECGSAKVVNVVLLGAASATGALSYSIEALKTALASCVPKAHLDLNERALAAGFEAIKNKKNNIEKE